MSRVWSSPGLIADEPFMEMTALEEALDNLRMGIDEMLTRGDVARAGEHRDVLETYRMFAHDQVWVNKLHDGIASGLTVEAAVERQQNEMRAQMMRSSDPFFRERLHDLDDLSNRLLRILAGIGGDLCWGKAQRKFRIGGAHHGTG